MPLSPPAIAREHLHTRQVECRGYRRADGLWDIEGRVTDTKTYSYTSDERGEVAVGTPVHDMWIRLTVDDDLVVQALEAVTDFSPFPAVCPGIVPNYQRVVGLKIGPGWTKALKARLGGAEGCTHLLELLGPIATTAFQTIVPMRAKEKGGTGKAGILVPLNSCHAFSANSPIIGKYAPDKFSGNE
jgi:hypothetical protein